MTAFEGPMLPSKEGLYIYLNLVTPIFHSVNDIKQVVKERKK